MTYFLVEYNEYIEYNFEFFIMKKVEGKFKENNKRESTFITKEDAIKFVKNSLNDKADRDAFNRLANK